MTYCIQKEPQGSVHMEKPSHQHTRMSSTKRAKFHFEYSSCGFTVYYGEFSSLVSFVSPAIAVVAKERLIFPTKKYLVPSSVDDCVKLG